MFYVLLIINIITFAVYSLDKWKAAYHKRRISEFSLLVFTFFGGTIGAVLGMMIFRHKISKKSFLRKFGLVIFIQLIIIAGCWRLGVGSFNLQ
ncbi:DUF1294 domain-containing protein [Chryseobacterium sp. GP-SGM7]|uniref:DUF1294 domain-containing protein n=1 Tax=Chryseobacterium sp. GP-SGM7 TaxID=3411323 RepID=UPI003B93CEF4